MKSIDNVFRTLANVGRRRVLAVIARKPGITVDHICEDTGMKQPSVSHHLARLEGAGLIERTRDRTYTKCWLKKEGLKEFNAWRIAYAGRAAVSGR